MGDRELSQVAATQGGLTGRWQARDELTITQLRHRLASGRLLPERRGVYRHAGAPADRWHDLRTACLAAGPAVVASHRSAAELWDLPGIISEGPEITAPYPQWPRLPGVKTHQSRFLLDDRRYERHGVPVTSPARTVVDLAAVLPGFLVALSVDNLLRRKLTTIEEIDQVIELLARRGRRGLCTIRAVMEERRPGYDPGDSPQEPVLVAALVAAGLPRPVQQHQVAVDGTVYLLDTAFPDVKLDVEYEGWDAHSSKSAFDKDRIRRNRLVAAGWTVLQMTAAMTLDQTVRTVVTTYNRLLRERGIP